MSDEDGLHLSSSEVAQNVRSKQRSHLENKAQFTLTIHSTKLINASHTKKVQNNNNIPMIIFTLKVANVKTGFEPLGEIYIPSFQQ